MEIFHKEVRHIVLTLKSSEEKQKKCKEKLTNVFRTIQNHRINNTKVNGYFSSYVKQILTELKETDEQNKSIRTCLRVTLIKINEQKKTYKNPIVDNVELPPESPFLEIQRSLHAGESHTEMQEIQADTKLINQESLVKSRNSLIITFEKFIGETVSAAVHMTTFSCKIPEYKKIKCKIKR